MFRKLAILWFLCTCLVSGLGAQVPEGQVLQALLQEPADSVHAVKITALLHAKSYDLNIGSPLGFHDLEAIRHHTASLPESQTKATLYNELGSRYAEQGEYSAALRLHLSAVEMWPQGEAQGAMSYNLAARDYLALDERFKAMQLSLQALRLAELQGDAPGRVMAFNTTGRVLMQMQNPTAALSYFSEALEQSVAVRDLKGQAEALNNLGRIYLHRNQYDSALHYFSRSETVCELAGSQYGIARNDMGIGDAWLKKGEAAKATTYFEKAVPGAEASGDLYFCSRLYVRLSAAALQLGRTEVAGDYARRGYELASRLKGRSLLQQAYLQLALYHAATGNYKAAYENRLQAATYRDSLFSEKNTTLAAVLEQSYQRDKDRQELNTLARENMQQKKYLKVTVLLLIVFFLTLLLLVVIGVLYIRQQKLKENLRISVVEQKLLRSQMNPHFIFNALNGIQSYVIKKDTANATRYLSKFAKLMRNILDNSADSHTTLDSELKLLENYIVLEALRFNDKFSFEIEVGSEIDPQTCQLPSMILQPFIENAIWHGLIPLRERDGMVKIAFHVKDNMLLCTIEDNGIGRRQSLANQAGNEEINRHKPRGLLLTKERLEFYNERNRQATTYTITDLYDAAGNPAGTRVDICFPYGPRA
jgi:tetratricopeptide (TPR) repeat protein